MKLIFEVFRLLDKCGEKNNYLFFNIILIILSVVPTYYLSQFSADNTNYYRCMYAFSLAVVILYKYFYNKYIAKLSLYLPIHTEEYSRFYRLDHLSKKSVNPLDFKRKLDEYYCSLNMMSVWGIPTFLTVISNIIGNFWLFYKSNNILFFLVVMIVGNIIFWFFRQYIEHFKNTPN